MSATAAQFDVESPAKNMQKKAVVRNATTASFYKDLTTTMQEELDTEHAEFGSDFEAQLGEVVEASVPANQDLVARGLEEVKILLQTEVHLLITRSLEEVKCLLQEEVHGRSTSERRLDERCDRLAEAVQAISAEHALQAAQAGSIEEVRSILQWLEDRWDKLDGTIAQASSQQATGKPPQGQDMLDTRIADLEERCKHLENTGKAQTEIIEQQKRCLEEHCVNLDKILATQVEPSGVDAADAPEVKRSLEEVKARCDKLNESLAALPTDRAESVSASASSAHERIDSLEAIVKDSFERLLQELECVKDCWRLQKPEECSGEMMTVYSPGRPQRLKSAKVMQDMQAVKQSIGRRGPATPREHEKPGDDVVVMVAPVSPTTQTDCTSQQPIEQCREVAEASVIELPAQATRHASPMGRTKDTPSTGSSSRVWPVPSLNAAVAVASPPAPKGGSMHATISKTGAWSPSHSHQANTPHTARAIPTSREHFLGRSSSKERMMPLTSSARPQISAPHSGGRSPSLDARAPMTWPLPTQAQQLPQQGPQEQQAQPQARPVASNAPQATPTMVRDKSMDARAGSVATPSQPPRTAPTPTATANSALLARAASPVRTPQMQSPRELHRDTMRSCGVRSPSMDPCCPQTMVQQPRPLRGSLGSTHKAMLTQCQPRRCVSGYVL